MAASELDKLQKQGIGTATTLSAPGKAAAATSITVGSTANFPTTTGITFAIRVVDGNGELVAGTYTEWVGTVTSGTTLAMNAVPVYGSDQVYNAGSTTQVYMPLSSYSYNKMIDGLLVEHAQAGTHTAALVTSRTEDTAPDVGADFLLAYDTSATALKKVKPSNLGITTGWISGQLPAVSSVTNNGNGSNDITFASTVANILTPGMRLRTTRTVAAPTQSTSLNGTTQYYSKATPTGLSFTTTFTCVAWIKPSAYQTGGIIGRKNGATEGFMLYLNSSGQLGLDGLRIAGNNKAAVSYQSLPLNKWSHVAVTMDMTVGASSGATWYINGVSVPGLVTQTGTASAIVQGTTDLVVGAYNSAGTSLFAGKIAQAAVYSSVLSAATILAMANQTLSGAESTNVSTYSFNGIITDLNANANNLTANGSAVATNADSPFTKDANGVCAGTYDWGIVTAVATTVATVQVPEGCAIPTSGGITTVDYSGVKAPFGFPKDSRFPISAIDSAGTTALALANTLYSVGIQVPIDNVKFSAHTGTAGGTLNLSQVGLTRTITGTTNSCSALASNAAQSLTVIFPITFTNVPVLTSSAYAHTIDSRVIVLTASLNTTTANITYQSVAGIANATCACLYTAIGI